MKGITMKQTEKRISYSVGMKVNTGGFQNVSINLSEADTFDVEGMTQEEIDAFAAERYEALREKLDNELTEVVSELKDSNA
jgi:hypothetical protein